MDTSNILDTDDAVANVTQLVASWSLHLLDKRDRKFKNKFKIILGNGKGEKKDRVR